MSQTKSWPPSIDIIIFTSKDEEREAQKSQRTCLVSWPVASQQELNWHLYPFHSVLTLPQHLRISVRRAGSTVERGEREAAQRETCFTHTLDHKHPPCNSAKPGLVEREWLTGGKDRDSVKNTGLEWTALGSFTSQFLPFLAMSLGELAILGWLVICKKMGQYLLQGSHKGKTKCMWALTSGIVPSKQQVFTKQ